MQETKTKQKKPKVVKKASQEAAESSKQKSSATRPKRLFKCCGGMRKCIQNEFQHLCVHCNRTGATQTCSCCKKEYHNSCLVQHFRMYGVCVCGMPLSLQGLRSTALKCCYCKRSLQDFELVFSCGHGACRSCWESFCERKQPICAECGAKAQEL